MGCNMKMMMMVMAMSMVLMSMVEAQNITDYPCIQALIPCTPAVNTTGTPPATCCGPLQNAVRTQLPCLCAVFQNTQLHAAVNVSVSEARKIPARCGISGADTMCAAEGPSPALAPVAGGPMSSSLAPGAGGPEAGGPSSTTGVASTPTMTPGNGGAKSVAWAGSFSGLMLLFAAGLMF